MSVLAEEKYSSGIATKLWKINGQLLTEKVNISKANLL